MLNPDFGSTDFRGLSLAEQLHKCREMANDAEKRAYEIPQHRDVYLDLARRCSELADEMERLAALRQAG